MKPLNSILIEGSLQDLPTFSVTNGLGSCTFNLTSGSSISSLPVIAFGKLADNCNKLLDRGNDLRIVGHLSQDVEATTSTGSFRLVVVAEHIEVRPNRSHIGAA